MNTLVNVFSFIGLRGSSGRIQEAPSCAVVGTDFLPAKWCCVCLSRVKEDEEERVLPCRHAFHRCCVDTWFSFRQKTCPLCRFLVDDVQSQKREELTEEMIIWFSSFHVAGF